MAEEKAIRILYMEDDPGLARLFQKKLRRAGYIVDVAGNGQEGLAMYQSGDYDVIAMDQAMPVYNGLEVIRILAARDEPRPPMIMVTGTGSEQIAVEAMKLGASDYIVKDVDGGYLDLLPAVIERVLQQRRLMEEKRQAEENLRLYARELERRNEELDTFAHAAAHDLKGPLGQMVLRAYVLAEDCADMPADRLRQELQMIARDGRRMANIIDELLLLSSVRKVDLVNLAPLDMAGVVADVLERLDYLIQDYQAEIVLPGRWLTAVGHAPWVEEVWANYISNAIKYGGDPPRVELGCDEWTNGRMDEWTSEQTGSETPIRKFADSPTRFIRFWVRDNGPGISPEDQTRLFTPFTRLDQVRAKGHGLGLSIVRRIVEKLGGEVGMESEAGRGSTFYFTLPAPTDSE